MPTVIAVYFLKILTKGKTMGKILRKFPLKLIWEAVITVVEVLIETGRNKEPTKSSRPD
jgi:hypothetical protein